MKVLVTGASGQLAPFVIRALREQLAAYDALRTRKCLVRCLTSCEECSQALIQARIATGMRQQELARC